MQRPAWLWATVAGAGDKSYSGLSRKGHFTVSVPQNSRVDSCIRHGSRARLLGGAASHTGVGSGRKSGCQAGTSSVSIGFRGPGMRFALPPLSTSAKTTSKVRGNFIFIYFLKIY